MTPFSLLLQLSGLSQREASIFLRSSPSSIDKWKRGLRTVPTGIMNEMRELIDKQTDVADQTLEVISEQYSDRIELGYPADDHEAQSLGWPCVGAWGGMAARIVAECQLPVALVPRGSTRATAAAADCHDSTD